MKPGKILNWLAVPFIYFVSILPFPLLYLLSDFLFAFIFFVWRYRKKIVFDNLRNSFPDASDADIKALRWFGSREEYVPGRVTEKYVDALEKDILSDPATWLWSHRRWKHKKPELAA